MIDFAPHRFSYLRFGSLYGHDKKDLGCRLVQLVGFRPVLTGQLSGTMHSSINTALGFSQTLLEDSYALARNKYRPKKVSLLLIAESPPSSGGYFYAEATIGKDHLFRETMKALGFWPADRPMRKGCDKRPMLRQFQSLGFFLVDTCELPVDKMPPRLRKLSTIQGASTIGKRVKELDPSRILIVKKTVLDPVRQALNLAGFEDRILNKGALPFPSHGNQRKYRLMVRQLLKKKATRTG